jgi:flagellar basal-body rod modification protein FlgD
MADQNSVSAIVKNGEVTNLDNSTKSKNTTPAGYDKDSFLQILVAQMKYQDPLEPTSNTEYINQYATFTQVEQLSNMANAMSLSRASEMVGKTVRITQVNADTGEASVIEGVVDYVTFSGNKAYLNINGENYSIDDVTEVLDSEYTSAVKAVEDFQKAIDKLPSNLDDINEEEHGLTIDTMYNYYMTLMDEKARNMMNPNYVTALKQYVARIDEIRGDEYRSFKFEE